MRRAGRRLAVRIAMEYHLSFPAEHPRAAAAALSPQESVSRNFQSPMAPYKFRSLDTPERGARVRIENSCCPLRGHRVYGVKRRE